MLFADKSRQNATRDSFAAENGYAKKPEGGRCRHETGLKTGKMGERLGKTESFREVCPRFPATALEFRL
jgi:hypothetical protein